MLLEKAKRKRTAHGLKGADAAGKITVAFAARKCTASSAAGTASAEVAVARSRAPAAAGTAPTAVAVAPPRRSSHRCRRRLSSSAAAFLSALKASRAFP